MLKNIFSNLLLLFIILVNTVSIAGSKTGKPDKNVDTPKMAFVRETFYSAVEDEALTEKLFNYLTGLSGNKLEDLSPLLLGYYGATETLIAKHAFNPFKKLSKLNDGLEKLAKAINQNPDNLEIRFLRFSILHYIPGFLGFSREREEDLKSIYNLLLLKDYSQLEFSIQKGIMEFLLDSKRLNPVQTRDLEKLLPG
jgi:hypothetical protein